MTLKVILLPETFLTPTHQEIYHVLTAMCLHVNRTEHVACNFKCLVETGEFFKVAGSHSYCNSANISGTVQKTDVLLQVTNRKWYNAYRILLIGNSDDLKWPPKIIHLLLRDFWNSDFYNGSVASDKVSTRVVKLPVIYVGGKLPVSYR